MMHNNKILTVSYGTFSCTLEGFDDSFGTMKAISEYFRDLAADDRYFGAEPPQPDAEMLARIAELEVSRRVEARAHEGRIMLKAHDEAVEDIAETPRTETIAAASAMTVSTIPEADEPQDIVSKEATTPDPISEAVAEDVPVAAITEDLSAIEDPAAAPQTDVDGIEGTAETPAGDVEETTAKGGEAEDGADDLTNANVTVAAVEVASKAEDNAIPQDRTAQDDFADEIVAQDVAISAKAFFANSPSIDDMAEDVEMEAEALAPLERFTPKAEFVAPPVATSEARENIAAKLQRIREVVSQNDDEDADVEYEDDTAVTETAPTADVQDIAIETPTPEGAAEEDTPLTDASQEIETALDVDDKKTVDAEEPQAAGDDQLAGILSRLEARDVEADTLDDDEDSLIGVEDDEAAPDEEIENLFDDDPLDDDLHEEAPEEPHAEIAEVTDAQDDDVDVTATPVQGRVMKVDRAELEAALDSGELEEFEGADTPGLSDAEEAELQRELDAVAAEAGIDEPDAQTASRTNLPAIDADASEDVSRLMAEADNKMENPEGATRRSAFAHLRAAVAARFADKTMREEPTEEENTKAYRSDLAEVVKPRRPVASGNRTERPAETGPTPLKLVAEQRIDLEGETGNAPVTPRRVAADIDDDFDMTEDTGFVDFAEEMGAATLPELLEAAAAYLSFVEGHEQFSRPQLMTRVRQVDCGEFSREDGLRYFGQLLRAGKIEKIKGGRFTVSDAIDFKPDERAAG